MTQETDLFVVLCLCHEAAAESGGTILRGTTQWKKVRIFFFSSEFSEFFEFFPHEQCSKSLSDSIILVG